MRNDQIVARPAIPGTRGSAILGIGSHRPSRVVDNVEVCERIDSSDEWIRRRSGIANRRWAGTHETVITMAVLAGEAALKNAGVAPSEVDVLLLASMSSLRQSPTAAPEVAWRLGTAAGAIDLGAGCAGFRHALAVADSLVRTGAATHVLIIGTEKMTDIVDASDRPTAFVFADGTGAALIGASTTVGIGPVGWGSDGGKRNLIAHSHSWLDYRDRSARAWPTLRMAGHEVYRWVMNQLPPVGRQALVAAGVDADDLKAFIPHQANLRIVEGLAQALGLPPHVAIARDVVTAGNTSAASIPPAMERILERGEARRNDLALLIGFGAGLVYAAQVVVLP